MAKRYAVYDTKDNLWIGDDKGPKSWGEGDVLDNGIVLTDEQAFLTARIAAELSDIRMDWPCNRCKARELPESGPWTIRDEVEPKMTTLRALQLKERGVVP